VVRKVKLFDDAEWDRLDSIWQAAKSHNIARVEWIDSTATAIQKLRTSSRTVYPLKGRLQTRGSLARRP